MTREECSYGLDKKQYDKYIKFTTHLLANMEGKSRKNVVFCGKVHYSFIFIIALELKFY